MTRIHLKRRRKALGLTQEALAAKLGKDQSFIAKLETGRKKDITLSEATELGAALGVNPLSITFTARGAYAEVA